MKWQKTKNRYSMAIADAGNSRRSNLVELWQKLIDEVLPLHDGVVWDYVRVEIWPDSGRIIAFPASKETPFRVDKSGCQVVFVDLLNSYSALADSDVDDDVFENRLQSLQTDWAEACVATAKPLLSGNTLILYYSDFEAPWCEVVLS